MYLVRATLTTRSTRLRVYWKQLLLLNNQLGNRQTAPSRLLGKLQIAQNNLPAKALTQLNQLLVKLLTVQKKLLVNQQIAHLAAVLMSSKV